MQIFRLVYRLIAITVWTAVMYTIILVGKALLRFWPHPRRNWRSTWVKWWASGIAYFVNMRVRVIGPIPQSPMFLVCNHVSYVDIILLFTRVKAIFVAKGDLEEWPVFNKLIKVADTIFINRENNKDILRVNALIEKAIQNHDSVIVFPEATSSSGNVLLDFKPSLYQYPAKHEFPVSCASIHYSTNGNDRPAYLSVCWWGEVTFAPHFLDFLKLSRVEATIRFSEVNVRGKNRKHLAQQSWQLVYDKFVPIVDLLETDEYGNKLDGPIENHSSSTSLINRKLSK